jgi:pimeloyl-ACP methyl ester carboxylesterase
MIGRRALGPVALGLAAGLSSPAAAQKLKPRTFVLVHGAWHGGWCWRRLADLLRADGHRVFTPTLTGLGERAHLMSSSITLDTHVMDIVNVFQFEDLHEVTLVPHSYGGWPASGAIEQLEDRISSVVFLDAFLPENGQKGIDQNSPASIAAIKAALDRGEVSRKGPSAEAFGVRPENRAWVDGKLTPQPIGVSMTAISLSGARDRIAKKAYIRAGLYKQEMFDRYLADRSKAGWATQVIQSGHDVMIDHPAELLEALTQLA